MCELKFKKLGKDVYAVKNYLLNPPAEFCDMSLGAKYIWRDEFVIDYAFCGDSTVIKESCPDYKDRFYYPDGTAPEKALSAIEEYCKKTGTLLSFCCIDNSLAAFLTKRYPFTIVYNDRNWSDYIYDAEKFRTYSGKKFGGQRNHVNKFKKLYPDYTFKVYESSDYPAADAFLTEFERGEDFSMWTAKEEDEKLRDYFLNAEKLGQCGGMIFVGNKVVALSFGEVVNETLIVHVEKGLKNYEGVYPTMANEFAKAFATDKVKYINREEDCGDEGLRVSKLQYNPIEIREKNFVEVKTLFDKIAPPVLIATERLTITDIREEDAEAYYNLYTDEEINRFYGYDYHEDYKSEGAPEKDYFMDFMKSLKAKKEEYSFAVRLDNKMIGEIVFYNFGYFADAEIGFRFFKEYRGKGYATESVSAALDYLKGIKAKRVLARAFKENAPSVRLIEKSGFTKIRETEQQYFYEKTL